MHEVIHKQEKPKRRDVRHEALARELVEDVKSGRPRPMQEVLQKVGYSRAVAEKQAKRVLDSRSFREIADSVGLGRESIAKVIQDASRAKVVVTFKGEAIETDAPDHKIRLAAASLLGDFTGDKKTIVETHNLNVNIPEDAVRKMVGLI